MKIRIKKHKGGVLSIQNSNIYNYTNSGTTVRQYLDSWFLMLSERNNIKTNSKLFTARIALRLALLLNASDFIETYSNFNTTVDITNFCIDLILEPPPFSTDTWSDKWKKVKKCLLYCYRNADQPFIHYDKNIIPMQFQLPDQLPNNIVADKNTNNDKVIEDHLNVTLKRLYHDQYLSDYRSSKTFNKLKEVIDKLIGITEEEPFVSKFAPSSVFVISSLNFTLQKTDNNYGTVQLNDKSISISITANKSSLRNKMTIGINKNIRTETKYVFTLNGQSISFRWNKYGGTSKVKLECIGQSSVVFDLTKDGQIILADMTQSDISKRNYGPLSLTKENNQLTLTNVTENTIYYKTLLLFFANVVVQITRSRYRIGRPNMAK